MKGIFHFFCYSLIIALSLVVFTVYMPFTYIDNVSSYIICDKDGKKFDIGPNFIYTFETSLDQFNDTKARKLCEYNLIKDYGNTLKRPSNLNYSVNPIPRSESSWLEAIGAFCFVFIAGSLTLESFFYFIFKIKRRGLLFYNFFLALIE